MNTLLRLSLCLVTVSLLASCERPPEPIEPIASADAQAPAGEVEAVVSSSPDADSVPPILVAMSPASGSEVSGHLSLSRTYGGLRILGQLSKMAPGSEHGFHLHEVGDCSAPDASSAGDHYDPSGALHGHPDDGMHHAGDLPNLRADGNGEITVDVVAKNLELGTGHSADIVGRAIVLHALPDDYRTQPAGASGERIACGVIGSAGPA